MTHMWHWQTREPIEDAGSCNYKTIDKCDGCRESKMGTMFHAAGATGRVCPVLFICDTCLKEGTG